MKKLIFTILMLISFILSNAQTKPAGLKVGDKAPEFTAKDQNDKVISFCINYIDSRHRKVSSVVAIRQ